MQNHLVGLDISDRSAEILAVARSKGALRVVATGRIDVPPGVIALGVIVDPDGLVRTLSRLLDNAFGTKRGKIAAGVSLPEMTVFSKTFTLPATLTPELAAKAVALEAADAFPIAMQRAVTTLSVSSRGKETQEIFFAAADRETVNGYVNVLRRIGVQPLFLDAESMAIGRALLDPRIQDPVLIADIGARTTILAIHDRGTLRLSGNVMLGGDSLTTAIEHKLGVSLAQAEELRRKAGFDPEIDDGKLLLVMEHPMNEIIEEMRRTIEFFEGRSGRKVRAILLAGGTSLTPQIAEYVGSNFPGVEVLPGNPLRGLSVNGLPNAAEFSRTAVLWSAALGLALRAAGARASPGINLMPGARNDSKGFIARITNALTGIIAMVTRSKKSGPKKAQAAEEPIDTSTEIASGPPGPVRLQIDAEPDAKPAASAGDVLPGAAPAAAATVAAVTAKEEKYYGSGIGDILGTMNDPKVTKMAASEVSGVESAKDDASRRSIASILEKDTAPVRYVESEVSVSETPDRGRLLALIILVVLFFSAAAGGIFMFVSKNGVPSFISGFFNGKDEGTPAPGATGNETELPPSVNAVVVLSTKLIEGEQRPVLVTRVIETDVKGEGRFPATGETTVATSGKASGKATIINETSQAYTFVATTRLLSKEGVLFRMTSGASIPANGSIVVDVAADQPGPDGDIGPTTFTIPGLPPATQKSVYAKSDAAMTGGSGKSKAVTAADLAAAKATIMEKLKIEAEGNLKALLAEGEGMHEDLITSTEISVEAPEPGSAASEFTMVLTLRYRAMLVPEKEIAPLLESALSAALPAGASAADYSLGLPLYAVEAYETASERAEVRVEAPIIKR